MITNNRTSQKFISLLILISILVPNVLFLKPVKVSAQVATFDVPTEIETGVTAVSSGTTAIATVTDTAYEIQKALKEILRQALMTVARRLLQEMTKKTVTWINSGFHGSPLFLENPKSFFKDIGKYEIKTLIDTFGYDSRRFPFGRDFALNTINSYKRQLGDNAAYTLSKSINDPVLLNNYRNDFDFGGWNGFLINTQYQQNNYIGFQLLATEELADRLQGTVENNAQKVRTVLDQGSGFLSPQTCADNGGDNEYNKIVANQFRRPSFNQAEYDRTHPYPPPGTPPDEPDYRTSLRWTEAKNKAMADWNKKNTCTKLVATTPGSVVANQITTALSSNFRQTELGAALGNNMSAIFDALLNQFLSKGLNALATTKNPPKPVDDWTYGGLSLGSPADGTNDEWNSGPDELVILADFKKQLVGDIVKTYLCRRIGTMIPILPIPWTATPADCAAAGGIWAPLSATYAPGDIANTQIELALMDSANPNNPYTASPIVIPAGCEPTSTSPTPAFSTTTGLRCNSGITQVISQTWPKIRELDMCIPGPNFGWQDRLQKEMDRNSKKLYEKTNDSDGEKAAAAQLVYNELKFAVDSFRDWTNNKMILELPNSITYMDAVEAIEDVYQQSEELVDKKKTKTQALARLQAIKLGLDAITTLDKDGNIKQPVAGSAEEKTMITLKKQYNAVRASISNSTSIDDAKNELAISTEKFARLVSLVGQCTTERTAKGWSNPGGATSAFSGTDVPYGRPGPEQNIYCDAPVKGGYDHGSFLHSNDKPPNPVTHLDLPYINAKKVYTWRGLLGTIFTLGLGGRHQVDINLKCNIIYNATLLDYKKDLPGLNTGVTDPQPGSAPLGSCTYEDTGMTADECTASGGSWNATTEICTRTDPDVTEDNCAANGGTWVPK